MCFEKFHIFDFTKGNIHFSTFVLKFLRLLVTLMSDFMDGNLLGTGKLRTLEKVLRSTRLPVKSMRSTPSIYEVTVPQS